MVVALAFTTMKAASVWITQLVLKLGTARPSPAVLEIGLALTMRVMFGGARYVTIALIKMTLRFVFGRKNVQEKSFEVSWL